MCIRVHSKEVKLKEAIRLRGIYTYPFNKGKRVWTSRDNKLWGSDKDKNYFSKVC